MSYHFSDGDPFRELLVFLGIAGAGSAFALSPWGKSRLQPTLRWIAATVSRTRAFSVSSFERELAKIDALRCVLGIVVTWRLGQTLAQSWATGNTEALWWNGVGITLSAMVTVGLFTPAACALLAVLLNIIIDNVSHSSNLGSMVASICLWFFALVPSGRMIALDRAIAVARPSPLRALKSFIGEPQEARLCVLKTLALFSYWLLCLDSGVRHLMTPAWIKGQTCGMVALSRNLNPSFYGWMESVYLAFPVPFCAVSIVATYGMLVWFIALPVLVFAGRLPRLFAIVWGVGFFLADAFVLPLMGKLGIVSLILWGLLFLPDNCRPVRSLFAVSTAGSSDGRVPPDKVDANRLGGGAALPAYALCFLVLAASFLLRLPPIASSETLYRVAAWQRATLGQSYLALGLGPVDVFNAADMRCIFRKLELALFDERRRPMPLGQSLLSAPDAVRAPVTAGVRLSGWARAWIWQPRDREWTIGLARYVKQEHPDASWAKVKLALLSEPVLSLRPTATPPLPNRVLPCSEVLVDLTKWKIESVDYCQEGLDYAWRDLPERVDAKNARLLPGFPAAVETELFYRFYDAPRQHLVPENVALKATTRCLEFLRQFGPKGAPPVALFEWLTRTYAALGFKIGALPPLETIDDDELWRRVRDAYVGAFNACDMTGLSADIAVLDAGGLDRRSVALAARKLYFRQLFGEGAGSSPPSIVRVRSADPRP